MFAIPYFLPAYRTKHYSPFVPAAQTRPTQAFAFRPKDPEKSFGKFLIKLYILVFRYFQYLEKKGCVPDPLRRNADAAGVS